MKITKEDLRLAMEAKEREYDLKPVITHPWNYPIRMNQIAIYAFFKQESSRRDPNLKIIREMMQRLWKEGAMKYDE